MPIGVNASGRPEEFSKITSAQRFEYAIGDEARQPFQAERVDPYQTDVSGGQSNSMQGSLIRHGTHKPSGIDHSFCRQRSTAIRGDRSRIESPSVTDSGYDAIIGDRLSTDMFRRLRRGAAPRGRQFVCSSAHWMNDLETRPRALSFVSRCIRNRRSNVVCFINKRSMAPV